MHKRHIQKNCLLGVLSFKFFYEECVSRNATERSLEIVASIYRKHWLEVHADAVLDVTIYVASH